MPKKLKSLKKTYFIKTFGCQMNVSDSERIAGFLEAQKMKPVKNIAAADLVIFNTCGVRKSAEDRAHSQVHNLRKNNPRVKIVLTGCLANRKDVQENLKDKVDLFCEIKDFPEKFVGADLVSAHGQTQILPANGQTQGLSLHNYLCLTPKYTHPHAAYVPIMTGCNNFCSYCVVPYARGREASRPAAEILAEIEKLIASGVKEITLLGQNVNSYVSLPSPLYSGEMSRTRDRGVVVGVVDFSDLLKSINALLGDFWIRFMTPHPKDMTDELIETITTLEKVCEAVHLPLQAGDDEILEKMNRKYTRAHYLELIEKIKKSFAKNKPRCIFSLSSDIIIGFPGETETQLEKTAEIMRKVDYDMVFFGQYSPRPLTAAWKLKDDIAKPEKVRREKYLNEILAASALKNNLKYLEKTFTVLVTNKKSGAYFGLTRTLKNVKIKTTKKNIMGQFVRVKITQATAWHLEGKLQLSFPRRRESSVGTK